LPQIAEVYLSNPAPFLIRLKQNEQLTDPTCDDVVVKLSFAALPGMVLPLFTAGQYVRLWLPNQPELKDAYFAIASNPHDTTTYDFVIKGMHPLSNALVVLETGQDVSIEGPMGKGFDLSQHTGKNVILMGVGTGIAPLRSLWLDLIERRNQYEKISIYAGFMSATHHLLTDELINLEDHDIEVCVSLTTGHDEWEGPVGYVQHALEDHHPKPDNTVVCLAGMNVMVDACTVTLLELGFNEQQILLNF